MRHPAPQHTRRSPVTRPMRLGVLLLSRPIISSKQPDERKRQYHDIINAFSFII